MNSKAIVRTAFLGALLGTATLFHAALAAELRNQTVTLMPESASAAVDFEVAQPMRVRIEAKLANPSQGISLLGKPISAPGDNRVLRTSGIGQATLEFVVSTADINTYGTRWVAVASLQDPRSLQSAMTTAQIVVNGGSVAVASEPMARTANEAPLLMPRRSGVAQSLERQGVASPPPAAGGISMAANLRGAGQPAASSTALPPPSTATPLPGSSTATTGRFRVTLLGATVNRATVDATLLGMPVDGVGDEVFFVSDVLEFNAQETPIAQRHETKVYGATKGDANAVGMSVSFPDRIGLGRASSAGGLEAGDAIPGPNPWNATGTNFDRLPMQLWEGTLTDGTSAVVIMPTVWEWDAGRRSGDLYERFKNGTATMFGSMPAVSQSVIYSAAEALGPQVTPLIDYLNRLWDGGRWVDGTPTTQRFTVPSTNNGSS